MEDRRTGRRIMKALVAVGLCALVLAGMATEALAAGTHRTWVRRIALSPPLLEPEAACLAANGWVSMCGTHEVSRVPVVDFDGFVATTLYESGAVADPERRTSTTTLSEAPGAGRWALCPLLPSLLGKEMSYQTCRYASRDRPGLRS